MEPRLDPGPVRACDSVRVLVDVPDSGVRAGECGIAHSLKDGRWCVDFRRYRTAWIASRDLEVVSR